MAGRGWMEWVTAAERAETCEGIRNSKSERLIILDWGNGGR